MARAVLLVAGLALAAIALLYAVTSWVVRSESDAALQRSVDVEIAALADIFATGGRGELTKRLADRLTMRASDGDQSHYMLADGAGTRVAGDIAHWPLLSAENSQAGFVSLADGTKVFARATLLDPHLRIVVAREYRSREALLRGIDMAFGLTGLGVVGAALLLAWLVASRLRARVDGMNNAFRSIEEGDLHHAVPGAAHRDELGEMAGHANRLVSRLGDVIRAQREVTDQVAHEIRTPLMHLDSQLLRMIERTSDPSSVASLGAIRLEARRIGDLLDSLLDIASSEAGRSDRSGFRAVDLSAVARDLAELYADSADDLGLDFRTSIASGVMLQGDPMQLTRAISNLLDNAFKYAGEGARVELAIAPGPRITVRDTGPGVPPELRERIFERFQRGPADGQGHGLGLALVRAIARRHGLEISCRDAKPGAEFTIEREGAQ